MKAEVMVPHTDLQAAVRACCRHLRSQRDLPLLATHFLLEQEGEELTLVSGQAGTLTQASYPIAKNIDMVSMSYRTGMRLSYRVPCQGDAFPSLLVPGHLFADYLALLPPGDVQLSIEENEEDTFPYALWVRAGNHQSRFLCGDGKDFPTWTVGAETAVGLAAAETLKEGLRQVVFAAAKQDEYRPWLEAVSLRVGAGFQLEASDGFRAAIYRAGTPGSTAFLIPVAAAKELMALLAPEEGEVRIAGSDQTATFATARWTLSTLLGTGTYPDLQSLVPAGGVPITLERRDLQKALKALSPLARSGYVTLSLSQGKLVVAVASEYGDGRVALEAETHGQEMAVIGNVKYLGEPLAVMPEQRITLVLSPEKSKPIVIRPAQGDHYTYLLAPMEIPTERSASA